MKIRWMNRSDLNSVRKIQNSCDSPMSREQLKSFVSKSTCICNVAEVDGNIVGYVLYEITSSEIYIINFAVHAEFRRQGIARGLISGLVAKLSERRTLITVSVPDSALPAQLLLRELGFKAVAVDGSEYKFLIRHA
jgi:ribosomal-protein-alanine N-acetyltransferase